MKVLKSFVVIFTAIVMVFFYRSAIADESCLRIWLIPFEPALERSTQEIKDEDWAKEITDGKVTIVNYLPSYLDDIQSRSEEFLEPIPRKLLGQKRTIDAINYFATENQCSISIRFLQWATLLDEIEHLLDIGSVDGPDIVQIGGTWATYLADKQLLAGTYKPKRNSTGFRAFDDSLGRQYYTYRWSTDYRFLYYWKQSILNLEPYQFSVDTSSWQALIESFSHSEVNTYPLAFAIPVDQLGSNIMHYYFPFTWENNNTFFLESGPKINLSSEHSLKVPRQFATASKNYPSRFVFPEISHPNADDKFIDGKKIRGTLSTLNMARKWYEDFKSKPESQGLFFNDYAMVKAPPTGLRGGSDFAITKWAESRQKVKMSHQFLEYFTRDINIQKQMILTGDFPAQISNNDTYSMLLEAWPDCRHDCKSFLADLSKAINSSSSSNIREYPQHPIFGRGFENQEVRLALLNIWRQMGRYSKKSSKGDALYKAAKKAEDSINIRIMNWKARLKYWAIENTTLLIFLLICATLLIFAVTLSAILIVRTLKERLDTIQKLLVIAATTIRSLDTQHISLRESRETSKRTIVNETLDSIERSETLASKQSDSLVNVVCRAIILGASRYSLTYSTPSALALEWDQRKISESADSVQEELNSFLADKNIEVKALLMIPAKNKTIKFHYLLEQALVCIIENAVKNSVDPSEKPTIHISHIIENGDLVVRGSGSIDTKLLNLINHSKSFKSFKDGVLHINKEADLHESAATQVRSLLWSIQSFSKDKLTNKTEEIATQISELADGKVEFGNPDSAGSMEKHLRALLKTINQIPKSEVGIGLVITNMITTALYNGISVQNIENECIFTIHTRI